MMSADTRDALTYWVLVCAFVLFALAACGVQPKRINLIAAGLACVVLGILFGFQ